MTPKEKAKELVDKFIFIDNGEKFQIISIADEKRAIQCALIAVDEMTKYIPNIYHNDMVKEKYWQEVKQEIQNL
jgi:hypothetical protein